MEEKVIFGVWLNKEEYPDAMMPVKAHETDAGYDLFSSIQSRVDVNDRNVIHTGIHLQIKDGWEAQIRPRSGLAAKHGITITNSPGTIDCSYTGEIMVILQNTGKNPFMIQSGDKIAQIVFKRVPAVRLEELIERPTNEIRGDAGFGSTGR